jgi:hypothetical protein
LLYAELYPGQLRVAVACRGYKLVDERPKVQPIGTLAKVVAGEMDNRIRAAQTVINSWPRRFIWYFLLFMSPASRLGELDLPRTIFQHAGSMGRPPRPSFLGVKEELSRMILDPEQLGPV